MEQMSRKELGLLFLEKMQKGRKFEEKVQYYFSLGMIHGTTHLSIGEEAVASGTCCAMDADDNMFATHRGHSQAISKGIDVNAMMAEIFGKETGVCKGKGGSMHIADINNGVMGANGILGASHPLACGVALASKKRGLKKMTVLFFGDGSTNVGGFHEGMNLASVWNLPILFVCANNTYGMSTHISKAMKETDITKRALGYGMPALEVDGNDVFAVYNAVREARDYVVNNGPMLMVQHTYRISGHSKSDGNLYRTKTEIDEWKAKCPIKLLKKQLLAENLCTQQEIDEIDAKTTKIIDDSVDFAINSPEPSISNIYDDLFA